MEAAPWVVVVDGEEEGPFTSRELKDLARRGRITARTPLRKVDMDDTVPAGRVAGLFPESGSTRAGASGSGEVRDAVAKAPAPKPGAAPSSRRTRPSRSAASGRKSSGPARSDIAAARRMVKPAMWISLVLALVTLLAGFFAFRSQPAIEVWALLAGGLAYLGFAYGLRREARTAAVVMTAMCLIDLGQSAELRQWVHVSVKGVFLIVFAVATRGVFRLHAIRREHDPEFRPRLEWRDGIWIASSGLVVVFVVLSLGVTSLPNQTSALPDVARSLRQDALIEQGFMDRGEELVLYYQGVQGDILNDGNLLTDRDVTSWWREDGEVHVQSAAYSRIASAERESRGDELDDSVLLITTDDGEEIRLLVPALRGEDNAMLREIHKRMER